MKYSYLKPSKRSCIVLSSATAIVLSLGSSTVATASNRWGSRSIVVPTVTLPTQVQRSQPRQLAQTNAAALARKAHHQINRYRQRQNLPPLAWNSKIAAQARKHSEAMAKGRTEFGHGGFQQRVRAIRLPFRGAAENVAYNRGYRNPAQQAVQGWLKSPGHKRNIEGKFDQAGIGVAHNAKGEVYFTQVFLRSR